jgi:ABC-type sugar transport system ATPase subunit
MPDTTTTTPEVVLEARNIVKHFGGVAALDAVNFDLRRGEVHAVVGENGAGKSTLMNVILGVTTPDRGTVLLDGRETTIPSPRAARAMGIDAVHQSLALIDHLDIAANLFLGREVMRPRWLGFLDNRTMHSRAEEELGRLKLRFTSVRQRVGGLSGGQRQAVAVARALAWKVRIVIMDEPTAALGVRESAMVIELIREVSSQGVSVIMISHKLPEVFAVAHRTTVMRLGKCVATFDTKETSLETVVGLITGATDSVLQGA